MKIKRLTTHATAVASPARVECDFLEILDIFWPIQAAFVVGEQVCDLEIYFIVVGFRKGSTWLTKVNQFDIEVSTSNYRYGHVCNTSLHSIVSYDSFPFKLTTQRASMGCTHVRYSDMLYRIVPRLIGHRYLQTQCTVCNSASGSRFI